jgi:hypothetical protein
MTVPTAARLLPITALAAGVLAACTSGGGPTPAQSAAARASVGSTVAPSASASAGAGDTGTSGPTLARTASGRTSVPAPYPTPAGGKMPQVHRDQSRVLDALPGSRSASCAIVGDRTDVRSGDVAAGNFVVARKSYAKQVPIAEVPTVFLYLIPQHAASLRVATARVSLVGSGTSRMVTSTSVEQADQWQYFAMQIPVRQPGRYRLTMAAGTDRGCFEVTFRT